MSDLFSLADRTIVQALYMNNDLSDNEKIVYEKIKANAKIQKSELALSIGRCEKAVQRVLVLLVQKGYIKRIGNNQYGYWEVIK